MLEQLFDDWFSFAAGIGAGFFIGFFAEKIVSTKEKVIQSDKKD